MPLTLDEEVCPHCRRPRDENEVAKGHKDTRQEALRLKDRPRRIIVRVAAAAAAAGALTMAWNSREAISVHLQAAWANFNVEVERARDPRSHTQPQASGEPSLISAVAKSLSNQTKPEHEAPIAVPVAPPAETPDATPPPPPPTPSQDMDCIVYGVVYDLVTKKPVVRTRIIVRTRNAPSTPLETSEVGHYYFPLRKNIDSITTVMIEAPGYRKGLIEDKDPPLRERSSEARASFIDETVDSDLDPVPVRCSGNTQLVALDLVLVPKR